MVGEGILPFPNKSIYLNDHLFLRWGLPPLWIRESVVVNIIWIHPGNGDHPYLQSWDLKSLNVYPSSPLIHRTFTITKKSYCENCTFQFSIMILAQLPCWLGQFCSIKLIISWKTKKPKEKTALYSCWLSASLGTCTWCLGRWCWRLLPQAYIYHLSRGKANDNERW